jgi:RNA polymerase sigma-70 factor (ECF subfamily)
MELPATSYSLLNSLINGSRRAETWQMFDAAYRPIIIKWCQRRGLQCDDALDVAQEILLKIPQKLNTFNASKGKFRSWLKTVVQNAVTDIQRRLAASPNHVGAGTSALHELLNNFAAGGSIEELATAFETRDSQAKEVCDRVRAQVEEQSWRIFLALVMEGREAAAVAKEHRIEITSVYKAKSRIVKRLKTEYLNVFGTRPDAPMSGAVDAAKPPGR